MYSIPPFSRKIRAFSHNFGLMLSSNCTHSFPQRPLLSTSSPRFRVSTFSPKSLSTLPHRIRLSEPHNRISTKRWKISCFRNEEPCSGASNPEFIDDILHKELEKPEIDKPIVEKRNWISRFREASDGVFKVIGKPWTVPWTADHKSWKISCVGNEEPSSGASNPEFIDDILHKELEKPEIDKPIVEKRNWISRFREAADVVFKGIGKPWTVPWTAETILQVMLLWIVSFWFIGSWMIPFGAYMVGISKESLTFRGQALFSLLTDVTEGLAGILILQHCLSRFRPLPSDWFKFSLKGNWLFDVLLGCFMFPLVNRLSQFNLKLLPVLPSTPITLSSVEQSILARDPVAMVLYALVLVVCAPLWEEIVFRGFLLPSLTKYMPVWSSILMSSVAFALAHFNVQRMLPLFFLGVVMGVIHGRSRNLLPSILLHSLWNGFVFLDLMK